MEGSPLRPGAEVAVASSRKKVLMLMIAMILIMTMTTTGFLIYEKVSCPFNERLLI